jgi:hypothetical protein
MIHHQPSSIAAFCARELRHPERNADRIRVVRPRTRRFTDAITDRPGRFELAQGGTVFLMTLTMCRWQCR